MYPNLQVCLLYFFMLYPCDKHPVFTPNCQELLQTSLCYARLVRTRIKPIHLRSPAPGTSGNWYTISQFLHPSDRVALKFSSYIDHREFLSRIKPTIHHHNFLDNSLFVRFHLFSFFSYRFIDLYFISMGVFACMCTICVELVPVEARRGHQKPWTWNYRRW